MSLNLYSNGIICYIVTVFCSITTHTPIMAFGKHSEDVIQIKIGIDGKNVHFARIKKTLWDKLGTALTGPTNTDRTKWIKNMSKDEFNIDLNSLADMQQFETFIEMRNYDDKGDWLRDKIRHFLNEN